MVHNSTDVADAVWIRAARAGDARAFGRLWDRHHGAALRFAVRLVGSSDAEDLVSESFTSIFQTIRNGAGPDELFRPYLYTSLKNLSIRWSIRDSAFTLDEVDFEQFTDNTTAEDAGVSALERSYEAQAFRSLPQRWQEVLWYGEVEGLKPRDIAPILGMSANAVAALSYRARDGFRKAWLELRANDGLTAESPREEVLMGRLRVVLVPLLVGIPLTAFVRDSTTKATAAAAGAAPSLSASTLTGWFSGAAVVGAASVLVASTIVWTATDVPIPSGTPSSASAPLPGYGQPNRQDALPVVSGPVQESARSTSPIPPSSTPPAPPGPEAPPALPSAATPVVDSPLPGQFVGGAGIPSTGSASPGSELLFTVDGQPAGSVTAGPDGAWIYTVSIPLADGPHELGVAQRSAGYSVSPAAVIPIVVDSVAPVPPILSVAIDRYAQSAPALTGTAEPHATVSISDGSSVLDTVVAQADGTWATAPIAGIQPHTPQLVVTQVDRAGNPSDALTVPVAFAPQFDTSQTHFSQSFATWILYARAWPGARYRTFIDGQAVYTGPGEYIQTVTTPGLFDAYVGGPYLSLGEHVITVAYVDPVTLEPLSMENVTITVTP